MFTGIIQTIGKIKTRENLGSDCRFVISPYLNITDWSDGESVAVNGVCLSVEKHKEKDFEVYASPETLKLTTLKKVQTGEVVNLERAVSLGERLGGHIVSGHVDCIASIESISTSAHSKIFRINFPEKFAAEVVLKGSIALDGISLTINNCGKNFLEVNIVPDSFKRTNIFQWKAGNEINMETDIIGKYVARSLALKNDKEIPQSNSSGLTREFLANYGFF